MAQENKLKSDKPPTDKDDNDKLAQLQDENNKLKKEIDDLKNKPETPEKKEGEKPEGGNEEELNNLKEENQKLKSDLENLQKKIDELQKDQKEKMKMYETESTTLDYLRPEKGKEKESRPKYINISNQIRGPPSRNYQIKVVKEKKVVDNKDKSDEKGDNRMDDRSNRAFMRFRRNQEQKKDDSSSIHKSLKVSKIAKDLEETLKKRKEKEEEEGNDENQNEDEK